MGSIIQVSNMAELREWYHPAKDLEQATGTGVTPLAYGAATGRKQDGRICTTHAKHLQQDNFLSARVHS